MWCARLDFVVLCVWASVVLCSAGIDQKSLKREGTSPVRNSPSHFIYPRTGRLFHADFVRDNEIFRSLERTNFMRRGPFARRQRSGRTQETDGNVKKHVYVGERRIPVEAKKNVLVREKDLPLKAVLFKVSKVVVKNPVVERRSKRDAIPEELSITKEGAVVAKQSPETSIGNKNNGIHQNSSNNISYITHGGVTSQTENKVDCDHNSTVKNNDTDKTLFIHDSTATRESLDSAPSLKIPDNEVDGSSLMKKTVVDDSLKLYPVYRGVKYYYPQTERRLVYSPQLTVQMNVPLVTETEDEGNSTSELQEEGRSRRPFKKLAFPLLLALKLKTAIMVPLILGLIGLISFKGLWSGLTALAIAAALGLKALVTGSGAKVLIHSLPPPPPPAHVHHLPPPAVEYAEYWSRRNDDHHNTYSYSDFRPSSWS